MDKETVLNAIKELKSSNKRNFKQSYDLIFTLSKMDLKKPENQLDFFHNLHFEIGKEVRVGAFVGPELLSQAKAVCKTAVSIDDFDKYVKDKKAIKKLADEHDYFIAQATIMPKVAQVFGRILGPKNKMPNPKAGCVVPPNANLKPLVAKLQKTVRVMAKTAPMIQLVVGNEAMKDEEVIDNVLSVYDAVVHHIPGGKDKIRRVLLKLSMSKPVRIE